MRNVCEFGPLFDPPCVGLLPCHVDRFIIVMGYLFIFLWIKEASQGHKKGKIAC